MAVKSVSSAAASSASSAAAKSATGIAGLLGAAPTGPAASSGAAGAAGAANAGSGTGTAAGGSGGFNFLQLLAQANLNGGDKSATPATPETAQPADAKAGSDSTDSTDATADAIAMALAMLSQVVPMAQLPQAAGAPNGAVAASQDAAADATTSAVSNAGAQQASQQNLVAALLEQADGDGGDLLPHAADQTKTDAAATDTRSSSNQTSTLSNDNSAVSSAAAHLSTASHFSIQHSANTAALEVKTPVGSSAWSDELGTKITWMAHQGIESASLQLSPAHLGPVEVKISVQDGGTSVWFGAAQADTRAALEQALPRLREMFSTQGLTLADAGVSREPPKQQAKQQGIQAIGAIGGVSGACADDSSTAAAIRIRLGLLDTYA
ncbi:MAG TPA: flagellar hook-length control protein FliK [Steroidobacteraceae bacterium]